MARWDKNERAWERQKGESAQAYEAFDHYLKQGDSRSLRKVAQELGKSDTLISRWSSKWHWQERLRQYTNEVRRTEFADEQKQLKKMRERQMKMAEIMQKKGFDALQKLDPGSIFTKDVIRLITEGIRLETEIRTDSMEQSVGELGMNGGSETIADTIIAAYQRRMEEGDGK